LFTRNCSQRGDSHGVLRRAAGQRIASLQKVMEDAPQAATIYYNGRIDAYEEVLRLLDSEGG